MNDPNRLIRIGTRGSELARRQADHVAERLRGLGAEVSIQLIQTSGDLDQISTFGSMGGKGIFVKEIETALLENQIDLAVHSLKDLPTELPEGLTLAAVLQRESPYDGLVSRDRVRFDDLPQGAKIATGSLRRASQALALRPDLQLVPLRGNVPTRVRKIREGQADATFLAVAGLRRLGMENELTEHFPADLITPPMGQGALALETRDGDLRHWVEQLNHPVTRQAVDAERLFIHRIGGGCKSPAGVLVEPIGPPGDWKITGLIASEDGQSLIRIGKEVAPEEDLQEAALKLADQMLKEADPAILATLNPRLE